MDRRLVHRKRESRRIIMAEISHFRSVGWSTSALKHLTIVNYYLDFVVYCSLT